MNWDTAIAHEQGALEKPERARYFWRTAGRVLIVDDNRDWAERLALVFTNDGYTVVAEHNSREGVDAAIWFRPDIAVLNIRMAGLSAYDAARALRRHGTRTPLLVAVTVLPGEWSKERAKKAGFDLYFTKPSDPKVFLEMLKATAAGGGPS